MAQREPTEKEKRIINRLALKKYERDQVWARLSRLGQGKEANEGSVQEFRLPYPDSEVEEERVLENPERKSMHQIVVDAKGDRCQVCGSTENLELHHIIPLEKGGPDTFENLIVLCRDCHVRTF